MQLIAHWPIVRHDWTTSVQLGQCDLDCATTY